jgi:hypothetical protein
LTRAGTRLAGANAAAIWTPALNETFGNFDPADLSNLSEFHPWFTRKDFEYWIDNPKTRERLCLISGERGAGATFCKQILRAKLDSSGMGYFSVDPTEVVAFTPNEAIGIPDTPSTNRTSAASFRYVNAQELIDRMRPSASGTRQQTTVAIDFGPEGGPDRLIGNQWQAFIKELLAEEWIRIVLIGLTGDEQNSLAESFGSAGPFQFLRPKAIQLEPISTKDFEDYAIDLIDSRRIELPDHELSERIDAVVGPVQGFITELQTAKFALAAIALEKGLNKSL